MNLAFLKQRPHTRIEIVWRHEHGLDKALQELRLKTRSRNLNEIERLKAAEILEYLFWKDMACESEYLPRKDARALAQLLITDLSTANSRYFSNGKWFEKEGKLSFSWNPCTSAGFDGGIIIQNNECYICIWFEDNN